MGATHFGPLDGKRDSSLRNQSANQARWQLQMNAFPSKSLQKKWSVLHPISILIQLNEQINTGSNKENMFSQQGDETMLNLLPDDDDHDDDTDPLVEEQEEEKKG